MNLILVFLFVSKLSEKSCIFHFLKVLACTENIIGNSLYMQFYTSFCNSETWIIVRLNSKIHGKGNPELIFYRKSTCYNKKNKETNILLIDDHNIFDSRTYTIVSLHRRYEFCWIKNGYKVFFYSQSKVEK